MLHSIGYIHNDIKLENLVLSGHNQLKLIDFGAASPYIEPSGEHIK
jgi:serine/threonine protein kinase